MKILFFGDVVGKLGRRAIVRSLENYRKKYQPDVVIANGENLAHGAGITLATAAELLDSGVDILTGGNHIFKKGGYEEVFTNFNRRVIRPANYPPGVAGRGYTSLKIKNKRLWVINLNGRVFFNENFDDPFRAFDRLKKLLKIAKSDIVIVDFHAEATSEKSAFSWYVDGRATAVIGTHTHVPTADLRILPDGTAMVSDVGMVGERDSVIGVEKEGPLKMFLTQLPVRFERAEEGWAQVNAVYLEVTQNKVKKFIRADSEILV
jgi:metallophosphoesterase (TIGR00282 family)